MLKTSLLLATLTLVSGGAFAEEGCPPGQLMSESRNKCASIGKTVNLPLDDDQPMRFEAVQISMPIIFIQAIGRITEDTPAEFERFQKTYDASLSKNLSLHSRGGNLMAGLALGEKLRKAGYNTTIGRTVPLDAAFDNYEYKNAICASACAYAFLGGVTRSYGTTDLYGLHRFGTPGKPISGDDAQVVGGILASYVQRMGVDQAVLRVAASASFEDDIFKVPVALAEKLRVIYDASGRTTFSVEIDNGKAVASLRVIHRGIDWPAVISCNINGRTLTVIDGPNAIPQPLRQARDFPVAFKDSAGRTLRGRVNYMWVKDPGVGLMIFEIPLLTEGSFDGNGLTLDNIWHPEIERRNNLKPRPSDAFPQKMLWADEVIKFSFSVAADNGRKTLPLVFNQCPLKRG